jgi:hypothetical protein
MISLKMVILSMGNKERKECKRKECGDSIGKTGLFRVNRSHSFNHRHSQIFLFSASHHFSPLDLLFYPED